jgi:hypothetical protein
MSKTTNIKKITDEDRSDIITTAFRKAVKDVARQSPKPNRKQRWHRLNYAMQCSIDEEIDRRYPDLYMTQARRLWADLILQALGLDLAGFSRRN